MYKFKFYDADLHKAGDKNIFILNPVINMGANQSWTVTGRIMDKHPNFSKLKTLKYGLQVYKNDKLIARCRLTEFRRSFNNIYKIHAEDKLAALNDSQCRPFEFAGHPEDLFEWFIDNHNSQVGDEQKLLKGNVAVADPNDYIVRSWDKAESSWNLMNSRLLETLGGYFVVRYEEDGDYLDWLAGFSLYSNQKIRFGENLLDLNSVIDATNTYTACIPYGAEVVNKTYGEIDESIDSWAEGTYYTLSGTTYILIDSETEFNAYKGSGTTIYKITAEENTGKRLTVASVNDGKDYIINETMAKEYGTIYAPTDLVTWDDVTRPENLLSKSTDWLNNEGVMLLETMEFSAVDLATAGININSFNMYENVRVETDPHGIKASYLITKMKVAADLSEVLKIAVGDTKRTLSAQLVQSNKNTGDVVQRIENIEKDYVKNEQLGDYSDGEDGKSAYEIWLEAGNTGTVDDFLESLSGANGRNLLLRTRDFGGGWLPNPTTRVGYGYEDGFTYVDFPAEAEDGTNRWIYNYKSALKKEAIWGKEFVLSYELRADEVWQATGDNLALEFALANESAMSTRKRYKIEYITPEVTTEWVRYEYKGTFDESLFAGGTGSFDDCTHFWIRFYNTMNKPVQVRKFKLELGSIGTEWTEAPEDTALAYSGGRNLILDSDTVRASDSYCVNTSAIETSGGHYVPSEPLIAGEEYTITACITPAEGVKSYNVNASYGNMNQCYLFVNGTERQITSATFKARYAEGYTPDDAIINANLLFYRLPNDGTVTGVSTIHWIKVEKGNRASDWTPAPEDVNTQISQELIKTSSKILQTSEEITLGILAGYTKTSDLEAYKKQVENLLKVNEEGVSMEFEQMAAKLNELGGEITTQKQYIRFIEGSIYIGHSDSPYSSVYTNDTLEFRYNDQMVARFTNEVLEVRNIMAENQVGFFEQWAIRKGAYIDGVGYNLDDISLV